MFIGPPYTIGFVVGSTVNVPPGGPYGVESLWEESKCVILYSGEDKYGFGVGLLLSEWLSVDEQPTIADRNTKIADTIQIAVLKGEADLFFICHSSLIIVGIAGLIFALSRFQPSPTVRCKEPDRDTDEPQLPGRAAPSEPELLSLHLRRTANI